MEYKSINLHYKRFRSKAPSTASLSPGRLVSLRTKGSGFLRTHYYDTVFRGQGLLLLFCPLHLMPFQRTLKVIYNLSSCCMSFGLLLFYYIFSGLFPVVSVIANRSAQSTTWRSLLTIAPSPLFLRNDG